MTNESTEVPASRVHTIHDKVTTQFADVFTGLHKFPGSPYKLKLKLDAVPAKQASKGTNAPTISIP